MPLVLRSMYTSLIIWVVYLSDFTHGFFSHTYVCIQILEIIKFNLSALCSSFVLQR